MNDTTDQPTSSAAADFRAIFGICPSPMLLVAVDPPRFTMLEVNRAHTDVFGITPESIIGQGVFEVFPDPSEPVAAAFMTAIRQSFERTIATRDVDHMAIQALRLPGPDGVLERRFVTAVHNPIFGPDGAVVQILSSMRDVTAQVTERQATEARALLMREVDHRARNALTVVQSLVRLTQASQVDEFKRVVLGRVEALARAQTSLARQKWEGAKLSDVVEAELTALAACSGAYSISGPPTLLPPEKVQAMSMVLHELATNAAKYGALSAASGVVTVHWRETAPGQLVLTWREDGGPPTKSPKRSGFGSRLIGKLARQLGGKVRHDWRPEGLAVTLTATL